MKQVRSNTRKICIACGPVETRYQNCPRCWGPVQNRPPGTTAVASATTPPPPPLDYLMAQVRGVTDRMRASNLSEEERQRLIDAFIEQSKIKL